MADDVELIAFVPARGGSERIPRKNLRTVHGIPLIARTVQTLHAAGVARVVVSTDDHEIADVASLWGAEIDVRPTKLSEPHVGVDAVVAEWVERTNPWAGATIVVAQPTSPLLSPVSVANAIEHALDNNVTVFAVTAERHLLWDPDGVALYDRRVNSNMDVPASYYRETGGVVVVRYATDVLGGVWPPQPRDMMVLDAGEAVDIDDYADLTRARAGAQPKRIQLRYVQTHDLGSGHRRRCETLAAELRGRHLVDVVDHDKVPVIADDPYDLVVLDILDTWPDIVTDLQRSGARVVSLEDIGQGARHTDITVNELYGPGYEVTAFGDRHPSWVGGTSPQYSGPRWAVLRAEFQGHQWRARKDESMRAVVTFGGTDPADMTAHVVAQLVGIPEIAAVRVIAPPARTGWKLDVPTAAFMGRKDELTVETLQHPCMGAEFLAADIAITSAGRTVHEAAACGCPVIALPVNEREQQHVVCPGVRYLPGVDDISLATIASAQEGAALAHSQVDGLGALRIAYLIDGLLGGVLW